MTNILRYLLPVLLLLFFQQSIAQKLLKGIVLDAEKKVPLPKASIFLSNTSIGTTANEDGRFELQIPAGRLDLIVSSIGYITQSKSIVTTELSDFITINLQVKAPELETVIIESFEKNGWEKWGRWFNDNFLGTSEYGRSSRIKNPEVLRFRNSKRDNALTVIALAPLIIENKSLGYQLTYQLEDFRYDFKTRYLLYAGYPFFENLKGSDRKKRGWEKSREEIYEGSMLQFMRALYRNKISEEGFEIRRLKKIPNAEKQRVKLVYQTSMRADDMGRMVSTVNPDSTAYYNHIMSQDDFQTIIGQNILPGDSVAYAIDSSVAGFFFNDFLLISYKNKNVPAEYKQLFPRSANYLMSEIMLVNGKPVEVLANGSFYHPEDLLSSGYWGWWEKIGTMLPFDYQLPKK